MAKKQLQKIKREKYHSDEQTEITKLIWLLVIIIILILGVYFFTRIFVTKDLLNKDKTNSEALTGEINYNTILLGSMFTKTEKEYYVFVYNSEDIKSVYYSGLISAYKKNKNALRVYTADLNNEFNKQYIDEENINLNTNNLNSFKVGKLALIKISNGKVEKAYSQENEIIKALEYIKDTKDTK